MATRETFPCGPELDFIVHWLSGINQSDQRTASARYVPLVGRLSVKPGIAAIGYPELVLCLDSVLVVEIRDGCVVSKLLSGYFLPTSIRIANAIARELGVPEIEQQAHDARFIGGRKIIGNDPFEVAGPLTLLAYRAKYRAALAPLTSATVGETP